MKNLRYKEYRLKSGLTQQELADKLNLSKSHVNGIECGTRYPSVKVLLHISIVLNTTPCILLNFPCGHCNSNSALGKADYSM